MQLGHYLHDWRSMNRKSTRRTAIAAHTSKMPAMMPTRNSIFFFDVKPLKYTNHCGKWKYLFTHLYHRLMLPEDFLLWITLLKSDLWETSDTVDGVLWIFVVASVVIVVVGKDLVASENAGSFCDVNCGRIWRGCVLGLISWNSSFTIGVT